MDLGYIKFQVIWTWTRHGAEIKTESNHLQTGCVYEA